MRTGGRRFADTDVLVGMEGEKENMARSRAGSCVEFHNVKVRVRRISAFLLGVSSLCKPGAPTSSAQKYQKEDRRVCVMLPDAELFFFILFSSWLPTSQESNRSVLLLQREGGCV